MGLSKLQIAVKAKVPILTCTTRDVVNLTAVLQHILPGVTVSQFKSPTDAKKNGSVYYSVGIAVPNTEDGVTLRNGFKNAGATLLIVNPHEGHSHDISMDVGMLPIPVEMMEAMLKPICKAEETLKGAMSALGGVTLREAYEIALFSMAEHKSLTPAGLAASRNEVFKPQKGLYPVTTDQEFYEPSKPLRDWVETERHFFLNETDPRLVPRGLMLDGRPGTGKSEAAKFIARNFQVPLYRLDIATTQDKWLGNSAKFLQANLDTLDQQQPCVVLIDEVEKVLSSNHGTYTTDLLSMLLWWMQTHTSKVLTICTTNDISKIPPEFYRPGRLDEVMNIQGIPTGDLSDFVKAQLTHYGQGGNDIIHQRVVEDLMDKSKGNLTTPATIEAAVKRAVKKIKSAEVAPKKKLILKSKTLVSGS
ncbi:ATPase domain-containing protein [Rhizobium phage RHph_Y1_11]|nr:ATPase domain-containing protein [Rhizobium phage RHph_Y1_11]